MDLWVHSSRKKLRKEARCMADQRCAYDRFDLVLLPVTLFHAIFCVSTLYIAIALQCADYSWRHRSHIWEFLEPCTANHLCSIRTWAAATAAPCSLAVCHTNFLAVKQGSISQM